jgi:AraC-like DNA-binding protein
MPVARDLLSVRDYGASHGSHDHDHFQILVGLDGVLELEVDGCGRRVGQGDGCVIVPGARHDFEGRGPTRCLVLDSYDTAWAQVGPTARPGLQPLASYLAQAVTARLPRARRLGAGLLLEAWSPRHDWPETQPERQRRAIDWAALSLWLRAHWHAPLSVAELAAKVHLSPSQFTARCQAEHGESPMQWLRGQRLAQARAWRASGLSVADTARRAGYRSPSALTAALRRESTRG